MASFKFIARDDREHRYRPDFEMVGPPESVCYLSLAPEPPRDIRWLDVTTPGEAAVRIGLEREWLLTPDGARAQVSETGLSTGEHLLSQIAARLLATVPQDLDPGAISDLATGLGETVAALEAAEALWIRDSGGRWHAAPRPTGSPTAGRTTFTGPGGAGERALTLQLVPPLVRSTPWIEVLAAGRSAEVPARLPLRWGPGRDR